MLLNHEKLDVYQVSIEFAVKSFRISKTNTFWICFLIRPTEKSFIFYFSKHSRRIGRFTDKDKSRFYKIARGSANECAAIFDITFAIGIIDEPFYTKAKSLLSV